MANAVCAIKGCKRPVLARGWCSLHYGRWQRHGDPLAERKARVYRPIPCAVCGIEFVPTGPARPAYCSARCKFGEFVCENCGETFVGGPADKRSNSNRFCSQQCHYDSGNHRYVESSGYITVMAGKDHPGARSDGRILEHRFVMQEHLGRPLRDDESVHHKNGDKADNRIKNLELRRRFHGKGQSVEDLVAWAREVLELYG